MADDPTSAWDVTAAPSEAFKDVAKSAGEELKKRLLGKEDSAKKDIHGFDMYATELYQDILVRVLSHEEFKKRHRGGQLDRSEILVSTMTIKHDKTKIGNANALENQLKDIWYLALSVEEEEDKLGRSFSLKTRFDVVKDEIFVAFTLL